MVRVGNKLSALVTALMINVNAKVVSLQTNGAVLVESPFLVLTAMAGILDDIVTLYTAAFHVQNLTRVHGADETMLVELETLVFTAMVRVDDQPGPVFLGSMVNVQHHVNVFRYNEEVVAHFLRGVLGY